MCDTNSAHVITECSSCGRVSPGTGGFNTCNVTRNDIPDGIKIGLHSRSTRHFTVQSS